MDCHSLINAIVSALCALCASKYLRFILKVLYFKARIGVRMRYFQLHILQRERFTIIHFHKEQKLYTARIQNQHTVAQFLNHNGFV